MRFWDRLVDHNEDMRAILLVPLAMLIVFNVAGIILGYGAIAKMQAYHYPPFGEKGMMYSYWFICLPPPDWVLLFWASTLGKVAIWGSVVGIPTGCAVLLQKDFIGLSFITMLFWTVFTGVTGVWTWVFTTMNVFWG